MPPKLHLLNLTFMLIFGSAIASLEARAEESSPTAQTAQGPVVGESVDGLGRFLGIPYAAAPVGPRRWLPPEEPLPWTKPLPTVAFGKSCPQATGPYFPMDKRHDEDCLFLNVFTPAASWDGKTKSPVMVWIPGGGLYAGESNNYDASTFAHNGVVVVTINYRLGVLGFFANSVLDQEQHALGNYGLMDQRFALEWVQKNIAAFGGDPSNVTLFGESAGGASALAQMLNPKAKALFHKVIIESGSYSTVQSAYATPSIAQAEVNGKGFATEAGCPDSSTTCLRNLPVQQILDLQMPFLSGFITGGALVPKSFSEALASGEFSKVPVLNGTNLDEWRFMVAIREALMGIHVDASGYGGAIKSFYASAAEPGQKISGSPDDVLSLYPLADYGNAGVALGAAETDSFMACPALKVDLLLSKHVPVYAYEFVYRDGPTDLPKVSFPIGAAHSVELQYLFKDWHFGPQSVAQTLNQAEQRLASDMTRYWTNFAKSSAPSPEWSKFESGQQKMALLQPGKPGGFVMGDGFNDRHKCGSWNKLSIDN